MQALNESGSNKTGGMNDRKFLGIPLTKYYKVGEVSFNFLAQSCEALYLVPFKFNRLSGEYELYEGWKRMLGYYFVLGLLIFNLIRISAAAAGAVLEGELNVINCMTLSGWLVYFVPFSAAFVIWYKPRETVDLLNSWKHVLACLDAIGQGGKRPLDDLVASLNVSTLFVLCQGLGISPMLFSFYLVMPHCWLPALNKWGLISLTRFPYIVWQVIFAPADLLTYVPIMLVGPFSLAIFMTSVGVSSTYVSTVRYVGNSIAHLF